MLTHNISAFIHIWNVEIHIAPQYIHIAPHYIHIQNVEMWLIHIASTSQAIWALSSTSNH